MYPDWPRSSADLVPLPLCDGPKLKAFDFQGGGQAIEFLDYLGQGSHAHVFKVQILGQVYALKLFRFVHDDNWRGPVTWSNKKEEELEIMSAFYPYAEPFSCECRAFGRLQETGHEDLALKCFGYLLLDQDNERAIYSRFPDTNFNGDMDYPAGDENRRRFLGRDGRPPPLRGIVKELGHQADESELQSAVATKILGDIRLLQQLGILNIDVATRQIFNDKLCDFSTAITVPHFVTTPELNPSLTPQMRAALELETFWLTNDDYLAFDNMLFDWNLQYAKDKGTIAVRAYPGGHGTPLLRRYELRNVAARERVFTHVDPRRYNWKRRTKGTPVRLRANPPFWVYSCGDPPWLANKLRNSNQSNGTLSWEYKDGLIFPLLKSANATPRPPVVFHFPVEAESPHPPLAGQGVPSKP